MSPRFARPQRGITLIEIILVCAIVAAATVSIFVFAKKASVSAAVETEQRQVEDIVKTVEGLFAVQPNFASLGTNGTAAAEYLQVHAARAGLSLTQDGAGNPALRTGLGGGDGTLSLAATQVSYPSDPGQPNNGFVLTYQGLTPAECISLTTSTASFTTKTLVGTGGTLPTDEATARMSLRGQLIEDKAQLSSLCNPADAKPSVFLVFAPARAITAVAPPTAPPAARCAPVHEVQQTACPAGQVGTITQERDGACTGANNSMVYTVWATTSDTCQAPVASPTVVTPPSVPDNCATTTFSQVVACPSPQTGNITQTRTHDSCAGTYTPWVTTASSCLSPTPGTCTPQTQVVTSACAPGQTGSITQSRSSTCATSTSVPVWSALGEFSNTCQGSPTCAPQRVSGPIPCPTGTYGPFDGDRERYRACLSGTVQAPGWSAWNILIPNLGCAACPATVTEPSYQWDTRDLGCASGETGAHTLQVQQVRTRNVSYSCPEGTTSLPAPSNSVWSGWSDTGVTGTETNTCAPATCTGASSQTQLVATTGSCPSGESGTNTWDREQIQTRTCNSGTWSAWGAWSDTGNTSGAVNTCAPSTCTGASSQTQLVLTTGTCPSGQSGSHTWNREQIQSRVCNSGTWSAWGAWSDTGNTSGAVNTCAPATCTGASSQLQLVPTSAPCPLGQSGTNTWDREQSQTRTCNSGTWSSWSAWADTGSHTNIVNTCSPDIFAGKILECEWFMMSTEAPSFINMHNLKECTDVQIEVGEASTDGDPGVGQIIIIPNITGVHVPGAVTIADPATWGFTLSSTPAPNYLDGNPFRSILFGFTRIGPSNTTEVISNFGLPCQKDQIHSIPLTAVLTHKPTGQTKNYSWTLNFRSVCYPDIINNPWPNRFP